MYQDREIIIYKEKKEYLNIYVLLGFLIFILLGNMSTFVVMKN